MSDIDICLDFHRCYGVLLSSAVVCDGLYLLNYFWSSSRCIPETMVAQPILAV